MITFCSFYRATLLSEQRVSVCGLDPDEGHNKEPELFCNFMAIMIFIPLIGFVLRYKSETATEQRLHI